MSTAAQLWSFLSNKISGSEASRLLSGAPIKFVMNTGEVVKWDHSVGGMVREDGGVISFGLSGIRQILLDLEPELEPEKLVPAIPNNPAPMTVAQEKALVDTGALEPSEVAPVVKPSEPQKIVAIDPQPVAPNGPKILLK